MFINYFVGNDTGNFSVCYWTLSSHGNGVVDFRRNQEESREVWQHSLRGGPNTSCLKSK